MENTDNTEALVELAYQFSGGMGGERDFDKALELYEKAYALGDWRGARGMAALYADLAAECSDPSLRRKYHYRKRKWHGIYMEMWHESLLEDPGEYDLTTEED